MIRFDSVTKQFGENEYALKDVSFSIEPGEFVFLTGPSGSGKTTIMRLLTKEYQPSAGDIHFEDTVLNQIKKSQVHLHRRKIGVVFQDYKLLTELNVWENIALALHIIGKGQDEVESRVSDLLRLVNLVDKAFLFPSQLSGGEAQRVSIARALATGPSVIFADEPTGNLDSETSIIIAKLLRKINELGTTVLLATHDLGVLQTLPHARKIHLNKGVLEKDSGASKSSHSSSSSSHKHPITETKEDASPDSSDSSAASDQASAGQASTLSEKTPDEAPSKPKFGLKFGWPFGKKKTEAEPADDPHETLDHSKNSSEGDDLHHHTDPTHHKHGKEKVDVKVENL